MIRIWYLQQLLHTTHQDVNLTSITFYKVRCFVNYASWVELSHYLTITLRGSYQ